MKKQHYFVDFFYLFQMTNAYWANFLILPPDIAKEKDILIQA